MISAMLRSRSGSSAVEFALLLPLLLIMLFGIIDGGRWVWNYNLAEKATQMGARMAVVTDPVASEVASSYVGVGGLGQGDRIPASAFGQITCTSASAGSTPTCTCTVSPCPAVGTRSAAAFDGVVNWMRLFMPEIQSSNVVIEYSSSGLGYAGNPHGPDLAPLVTVKLGDPATPLQFSPVTSLMFATFNMPTFTTTLTAEDLTGSQSN